MAPQGHQQRRRRGGRGGGNNQRNAQRKQAWPHRNGGNGQRQQQQGARKKQQGWRQNSRSQLRRGTHNSITGHESSAPKKLAASAAAYTPPGRNSRPRAGSGDTARSHISEMSAASVLTEVAQDTTIRPAGNANSAPAWGADVANGGRPTAGENPFSEDAGGPNGPHHKSRANWRQSKKERMMQKLTTERDRQVFRLIKNGDHDDRLKDLINYKGIEPSESFLRKTAQCAAKFVRHKCIFLLVDHCGVDVDTNLQKGCTALHYAAFAGSDSLCRGLMYRGANRETLNSYGETPAGTARSQGHEACAKMIEGYDIAKEHLGMINKERRASQRDAADASPRGSSRSPPGSPKSPAMPQSGAEASGRELAWRRRDAQPAYPASAPVGATIAAAAQEAYAEEDSAAAALDAILNPPAKQKRRVRRLVRSLQRLKLSYLEMPHLIRNVLLQLAQMEVFERTRVAKSLLRKVIVSEEEDPQTFLVALCAKMFAAQLEICGGQPDGEGPPVNEAVAPDDASAATATSGSSATTMSSFGSRSTASSKSSGGSPRDSDDGSSVFSDVSMNSQLHKALLHSTTFLDVCLQLCTQETDRVKKMLTGSLCLDIGNEDDMIIENVEQLSRETLEARVTIMEKLIVELQNHRGGIISA